MIKPTWKEIGPGLGDGASFTAIALRLDRTISTVSQEVAPTHRAVPDRMCTR
jgi:hypothetical protein